MSRAWFVAYARIGFPPCRVMRGHGSMGASEHEGSEFFCEWRVVGMGCVGSCRRLAKGSGQGSTPSTAQAGEELHGRVGAKGGEKGLGGDRGGRCGQA